MRGFVPKGYLALEQFVSCVGRAKFGTAWLGDERKALTEDIAAGLRRISSLAPPPIRTIGAPSETNYVGPSVDALRKQNREIRNKNDEKKAALKLACSQWDEATDFARQKLIGALPDYGDACEAIFIDDSTGEEHQIPPVRWQGNEISERMFRTCRFELFNISAGIVTRAAGPILVRDHSGSEARGLPKGQLPSKPCDRLQSVHEAADGPLPDKNENLPASTAAAERKCKLWLVELMQNDTAPIKRKEDYKTEFRRKLNISTRGFARAWGSAVAETANERWTAPGPKSTRRIDTPIKS